LAEVAEKLKDELQYKQDEIIKWKAKQLEESKVWGYYCSISYCMHVLNGTCAFYLSICSIRRL